MSDDDGACGNDAISRADYDAMIVQGGGGSGSGSGTDTGWNTGGAVGSGSGSGTDTVGNTGGAESSGSGNGHGGPPAWQDLDADDSGCVTQVTFVF